MGILENAPTGGQQRAPAAICEVLLGQRPFHRLRDDGEAALGRRRHGDLRGRLPHARPQHGEVVEPAEPAARRRRAVPQSLARQGSDPRGHADHRRAGSTPITTTASPTRSASSTARATSCSPIRAPATRCASSTSTGPTRSAAPPPRWWRLKWLGPKAPQTLGLVGIGTMGENCLRCLQHLYTFRDIVCTSRRKETREAFAQKWSAKLGIPVRTRRQRRGGGARRRSRDRRHHAHRHRQPRAVGQARRDLRVARAPRDGPGRLGASSTRS